MTTRREFLQSGAGALAGLAFVGCDLAMLGGTAMKLLGIRA